MLSSKEKKTLKNMKVLFSKTNIYNLPIIFPKIGKMKVEIGSKIIFPTL